MNIVNSLRQLFGKTSVGKSYQQSIDLCELALYLSAFQNNENQQLNLDQVLAMELNEQQRIVQDLSVKQVVNMFECLQGANDVALATDCASGQGNMDPSMTKFGQSKLARRATETTDGLQLNEQLIDRLGFVPRVGKSTIQHPDAGEGVFVTAHTAIPQGTVLALYPGLVYAPYQVGKIISNRNASMKREYEELFGSLDGSTPNNHSIQRYDGIVINASSLLGQQAATYNPYAVAHKVNHPPRGKVPNSVVCAFNMRESDISEELSQAFGCNRYWDDPLLFKFLDRKERIRVHMLALVAACSIAPGDELFVNYRYNPELPSEMVPDWYYPVDKEEDRRRWSKK